MSINLKIRPLLCWLLVLSLVFQPVIFEVAVQANEQVATVEESDTQTQDSTQELANVDTSNWEIKMNFLQKLGVSIGNFFKKGLKKQIKKAKKELAKAKVETEASKKQAKEAAAESRAASQGTKASVATSQSARNKDTLSIASGEKSKAQEGLLKVGESLNAIAEVLSTIGTALGAVGVTCSSLSGIPYVGALLGAVGGVLKAVSGILAKVAAVIKVAAKAVIAAANASKLSDVNFDKYAKDAARAWKNSGNEYKSSGKTTEKEVSEEKVTGTEKEAVDMPDSTEEADIDTAGSPAAPVTEPDLPPNSEELNLQ